MKWTLHYNKEGLLSLISTLDRDSSIEFKKLCFHILSCQTKFNKLYYLFAILKRGLSYFLDKNKMTPTRTP